MAEGRKNIFAKNRGGIKMKKIMSMVMMAIFVLSIIPASMAEEETTDEDIPFTGELQAVETADIRGITAIKVDPNMIKEKQIKIGISKEKLFNFLEDNKKKLMSMDLEECAETLKEVFPNRQIETLKRHCKNLNEVRGTIRPAIKKFKGLSIENQEKLLTIGKERIGKLSRAEIKKVAKGESNLEILLKDREDFDKKLIKRNIVGNKLIKINKQLKEGKELYKKGKEELLETKEKFVIAKKKMKSCKGDDSDKCNDVKDKVLDESKKYLLKLTDMILKTITRVENVADKSEDLTEDEVTNIKKKAKKMRENMDNLQKEIVSINKNSTKEERTAIAKRVRSGIKDLREYVAELKRILKENRVGAIIARANHLEDKMENIVEKMEDEGLITEELELMIEDMSENILTAKELYKLSLETETQEEKQEYLDGAKKEIRSAYKTMKELLKILRSEEQENNIILIDASSDSVGIEQIA